MSYWANNPELYDEIIVKEAKAQGIINENDERFDYEIVQELLELPKFSEIALAAEKEYWGSKIDEAMIRRGK